MWRAREDSNLRPPAPQAGALIHLSYVRKRPAGAEGIEPPSTVLETVVMPLDHAPKRAPEGTRTPNPRDRSPVLFPVELRAHTEQQLSR